MTDQAEWIDEWAWLDEVDYRLSMFRSSIKAGDHQVARDTARERAKTADHGTGANSFVGRDTIAETARRARRYISRGDFVLVALGSQVETGTVGRGRSGTYRLVFHGDLQDSDGDPRQITVDVQALEALKAFPPDDDPGQIQVRRDDDPGVTDGGPGRIATHTGGWDGFAHARRPTPSEIYEFADELSRRVGHELDPDHNTLQAEVRRLFSGGWYPDNIPARILQNFPPRTRNFSGIVAGRLKKLRTDPRTQPKTKTELLPEVLERIHSADRSPGSRGPLQELLFIYDFNGGDLAEWLDDLYLIDLVKLSAGLDEIDDELRSVDRVRCASEIL